MRQLWASLRRSPSAAAGILVTLVAAAAMATVVGSMIGTAVTMHTPVRRLAAAPVVVIGDQHVHFGHGDNAESLPLTAFRPVPDTLAGRLRTIPGVTRVVADVSVPVSVRAAGGTRVAATLTAHGWSSAALTPDRLTSGRAPRATDEIALPAATATRLGMRAGDRIVLTGRDSGPFTVTGLTAGPGQAFLTDQRAAQLAGRSGAADLLGVFAAAGETDAVAARIKQVAGPGFSVLTGAQRGRAEDVASTGDKQNMSDFALGAGIPLVVISLFVVAGAVGLSVAGRRRNFALLRAVGATPGQLRRGLAAELAVLGVVGGLLGYPLGVGLARVAVAGMARHGLMPAGTSAWSAGWLVPIVCGAGLVVAQLSGFVAGWRAGRTDPALALRETAVDRTRPSVIRLLLGIAGLGGGITLSLLTFNEATNPTDQMNLALMTLLCLVAAVALLGPVLVRLAELVLRAPLRLFGGPGARLALADIQRRPGRIASAVVAVALSVGFLGTVYLVNATALHADETQTAQRMTADVVLTAPGGVQPSVVTAAQRALGVRGALGVASTTVFVPQGGGEAVGAAALTGGDIAGVLKLDVVSGRLDRIRPGQIALSRLEAGSTKVGTILHTYLADGTPYAARLVAVYRHGMGFGDAVIPLAAAGGGHLGSPTLDQVLVAGRTGALSSLHASYPGLTIQSQGKANAAAKRLDEQDNYLNTMIVLLIGLLAAVSLVNTLVCATLERRESLLLLDRVGADSRQLLAMAGWQTAAIAAMGVVFGVGSGAAALIAVTRALTGDWHPYLPAPALTGLGAAVVGLTAAAILVPTAAVLRRGAAR
jgi:putative ABC transport system permease protein